MFDSRTRSISFVFDGKLRYSFNSIRIDRKFRFRYFLSEIHVSYIDRNVSIAIQTVASFLPPSLPPANFPPKTNFPKVSSPLSTSVPSIFLLRLFFLLLLLPFPPPPSPLSPPFTRCLKRRLSCFSIFARSSSHRNCILDLISGDVSCQRPSQREEQPLATDSSINLGGPRPPSSRLASSCPSVITGMVGDRFFRHGKNLFALSSRGGDAVFDKWGKIQGIRKVKTFPNAGRGEEGVGD